jgi:hypothetical protein
MAFLPVVAFYGHQKYLFPTLVALLILCNLAVLSIEVVILPKSTVVNIPLPPDIHIYVCALLNVDIGFFPLLACVLVLKGGGL